MPLAETTSMRTKVTAGNIYPIGANLRNLRTKPAAPVTGSGSNRRTEEGSAIPSFPFLLPFFC